MFPPMNRMTERIRNQNEQQVSKQRAVAFTLPTVSLAPLRKLFSGHRRVPARQTRSAAEATGC